MSSLIQMPSISPSATNEQTHLYDQTILFLVGWEKIVYIL